MISKPSKSARKREFLALQALGEQLIDLTVDQLDSIGLSEALLDAVIAAKSITAHGALRRQKQLIGKIMRDMDPDPIKAAIDRFGSSDRMEKQIFREAEAWRERLTTGDASDLAEFTDVVGHRNEELVDALADWFAAPSDGARRLVRRKIFREIHKDLASRMQNTSPSI